MWSPRLSDGFGWFPQRSPNGRWVMYSHILPPGQGRRLYVAEVGGTEAFLDANAVPVGWWDDRAVYLAYYENDTLARLRTYHVPSGVTEDLNVNASWAAGNKVVASGTSWASFKDRTRDTASIAVLNNQIIQSPSGSVALNGDWLVTTDPNTLTAAGDYGFRIYHNGQFVTSFLPQIPNHQFAICDGQVLYGGYDGSVRLYHLTTNSFDVDFNVTPWHYQSNPNLVRVNDTYWIWCSTTVNEESFVIGYPVDALSKTVIVVRMPGVDLNVTASNGQFHLASTDDKGRLYCESVASTTERVMLEWSGALPVCPIPSLPRKLWLGYFKTQGRYGNFVAEALMGKTNCTMYTPEGDSDLTIADWREQLTTVLDTVRSMNAGLITTLKPERMDLLKRYWDSIVAIYVSPEGTGLNFEDVSSVNRDAAVARQLMRDAGLPMRPVVCYIDGHLTNNFRMPNVDWMAIQTYLPPQTDSQTARDLLRSTTHGSLARIPSTVPILLIAQAYDRTGAWKNINVLEDLQPVYADLARENANVLGILYFSYSRPGGVLTYPQLKRWHQEIYTANPGRPDIVTVNGGGTTPVTGKPSIQIIDWSRTVKKGERAWITFKITGPRQVTKVSVDLKGDGASGWDYTFSDARNVLGVYFDPQIKGSFSVEVSAFDTANVYDVTGSFRSLVVS